MKYRLIQLDAMRGFAALMVVGFHYTTGYHDLYGHPGHLLIEFPDGRYGVQLFFIISGFVIFMTLEKTEDARDFLVSRFSRLYPAYWASVLITYIIVSIASLPGRETTLYETLFNFTMLQQWFRIPHVDGAYWTLTLELSFYALMLGLFLLRCLNRINVIATAWLSMMIAVYIVEQHVDWRVPGLIKTALLLEYANLFLAGIIFYKLYRGDNGSYIVHHILMIAALAVEFTLHGLKSGLICTSFIVIFYGVFILKIELLNRLLSAKPFVYLGSISYSLYLLHQNIGYVLLRTLYAANLEPVLAITFTCAVSVLLASIVTMLIDVPARSAIRSFWRNNKAMRKIAFSR
ncbi:MAG: acyltransferase [Methylobacter sp.]|uniref:acyltransferase family protein n=1 Tax=Methylobacter sp. TaxID=2051955 RepID=UPI002586E3CA|nr:acyltransferase [Methylobacter sp.]MCL7422421.1 acyltransferase [Methylobacter sp.]